MPGRTLFIVWPTPETDPSHRSLAPARHGVDVIELEKLARRAAMAGLAHKRALALIALPDRAPDLRWHIARFGARGLPRPRFRRGPELPPLELVDERVESAFENLGDISRGGLMAQQLLGVPQLVMHAPAHRELDCEALG